MKHLCPLLIFMLLFAEATSQVDETDFYRQYTGAIENGRIQDAITIGELWKEASPTEAAPHYFTAKAMAKKGRRKEALQYLNNALAVDSTHVPSLLASAELSDKASEKALICYEKLIMINPVNSYFYREAAECAKATQKFEKAISYYSMAYQYDDSDLITVTGFAQLLMDFRQFADADTLLSRAIEIDPSNRFSRLAKGKIAFDDERWADVLKWVENVAEDSPSPAALRFVGISQYYLGLYGESVETMRALSNLAAKLDYPHYYMGLCMEKLGDPESAKVQYGQALNKALSSNLGTYYERLGLMYQESNDHRKAIENFAMAKKFSARNILNFHLAKSYDSYYQDEKMAFETFEVFVENEDTLSSAEKTYAQNRLDQLKKQRHFNVD